LFIKYFVVAEFAGRIFKLWMSFMPECFQNPTNTLLETNFASYPHPECNMKKITVQILVAAQRLFLGGNER